MGSQVKNKGGRPRKYKTQAEAKAAHAAQRRAARRRRKREQMPWADQIADKLNAAEEASEPMAEGLADLPPVVIDVPPSEATSPDEIPTDPGAPSQPKEEPKPAEAPEQPKSDAQNVNGEEMAQMGAALWVEGLKQATAYANAAGFAGIGEPFLTMNHQGALILLRKALEETTMPPEEFAAYVCGGSGVWVGWNAYRAWKKNNPPKQNPNNRGAEAPKQPNKVMDAEYTDVRRQNANGVADRPAGDRTDTSGAKPVGRGEYV